MNGARWTPIRVATDGGAPCVAWCWTDGVRFDDPFFAQTIERCLRDPFRLLFQRQTPLDQLEAHAEARPPTGLVYHLSRSGSTLVSRMLEFLPDAWVLSEPGPVDSVLTYPAPLAERARWLHAIVSALGPDTATGPYVLKLDAWAVLDFDVFEQAFPDVPWVFCYRHPGDVLVSQSLQGSYHMIPGALPAWRLGEPLALPAQPSLDEYGAAMLGRLLDRALRAAKDSSHGLLVHNEQLPGAVLDRIAPHFGIRIPASQVDAILEVTKWNAKNPVLPYAGRDRRADASPEQVDAVDRLAMAAFERLERRRDLADAGA
ncbi:MAG: hypothetical protein M3386_00385 [Actinomycetota bacterium]|nr:hypothetical protein [Actinomycetota bacterium]